MAEGGQRPAHTTGEASRFVRFPTDRNANGTTPRGDRFWQRPGGDRESPTLELGDRYVRTQKLSFAGRSTAAVAASLLFLTACGGDDVEDAAAGVDVDAPGANADAGADAGASGAETPASGGDTSASGGDTSASGQGRQFEVGQPAGNISLGLMLTSVQVRESDLDDGRQEFVDYCFGAPINEVSDSSIFGLQGFDVANFAVAEQAQLEEDDPNCVVASFASGTDVGSYTIGVVGNGVVQDRSGEVNVADSRTITGGKEVRGSGGTSGPDLLRVGIDPTLEQVEYVFDENELRGDGVSPDSFGYYTPNGERQTASRIVSVEDSVVVAEFEGAGSQVDEAARFFAADGAVQDQQGTKGTFGAVGGRTAAPDLIAVTAAAGASGQYDFRFDEPVEDEQLSQFFLYTNDTQTLTGQTVTIPNPQTVRVSFPRAADFTDAITRGAVGENAVRSLGPAGTGNTIGAAALETGRADSGATSGPDLLDVTLDPATGQATFIFDATLVQDSPKPGSFFLIAESGSVEQARDVVNVTGGEVTGNMVVVLFNEAAAQAATAATVGGGAVTDQQGNNNPTRTVDAG